MHRAFYMANSFPTRSELHLDKRICTALDRVGLRTVADIVGQSSDQLMHVRGLGWRSIMEIEVALALYGLALKPSEDE